MKSTWAWGGAAVALLVGVLALPGHAPAGEPSASPAVVELLTRNLLGTSNREVRMLTVAYLPGGASRPHRHDAQVFVYVLEGAMTMQVDGAAAVTLGPGQTFYEGPHDVHRVSANASQTEPAKILVVMIKDKRKPASRPVTPKETP